MPKVEMTLGDYLRVIRKRKRIIILCLVVVVLTSFYYVRTRPPIYRTSAKIKIDQRKSVATILTEIITWSPGDVIASQTSFMKSYQLMERVAERMNLVNPSQNPAEKMAVVKGLQDQIQTEQVENANIIQISAASGDAQQVMNLVNAVAETFVQVHFENKKTEASNARNFIKAQLDSYAQELQDNEKALQEFKEANPLVKESGLSAAGYVQSDPRLDSAKQELVKAELELAALKSRYTDDHPAVIVQKRKLANSRQNVDNLAGQIAVQQKELSSKEIKLLQLKRNIDTAQEIFLMFKKRYEEARIAEAEIAQDATIIEPAGLPSRSNNPSLNFALLIGVFGGLMLGFALAFVTENLDTSLGRIEDIEEVIKLPVLGIIPSLSLEKDKKTPKRKLRKREKLAERDDPGKSLIALFEPTSIVSEAYRALRTQLEFTGLKKIGNSLVITSSAPGEGKTQTVCNLGIIMAQAGQRVVLIGSDFRKSMIERLFGLKRSPGLSDVLMGNIPWKKAVNTATDIVMGGLGFERVISTPGIENLHILTCGEHPPNPAEMLSLPGMKKLLQELKQNFDVVLLDSSPVLPVTDAAILGSMTDGVLLVYEAGRVSRHALLRAKAQLENVGANIWGIVINNVKAKLIEDVTPYQKYRYYGYYREKREKPS